MIKKLLAVFARLLAAAAFAAIDVNKATQADLESIKGIGPVISTKILDERKKGGPFKDWNDVITRVKGIGEGNAAKFSGRRPDRQRQGLSRPRQRRRRRMTRPRRKTEADAKADKKARRQRPIRRRHKEDRRGEHASRPMKAASERAGLHEGGRKRTRDGEAAASAPAAKK